MRLDLLALVLFGFETFAVLEMKTASLTVAIVAGVTMTVAQVIRGFILRVHPSLVSRSIFHEFNSIV